MYEDIYIIKDFIGATEVCFLTDDFILAFGEVLSEQIALCVRNFFDTVDAYNLSESDNPFAKYILKTRKRMDELIGEKVRKFTFASYDIICRLQGKPYGRFLTQEEEKARIEFLTFLGGLRLDTALKLIPNYNSTYNDIKWLMENEKYWIAVLPVRTKIAYDKFRCCVETLSMIMESAILEVKDEMEAYRMPEIHNLCKIVYTSSKFFYQANEKPTYTRISSVISNAQTLKVLQRGLEYTIYCGNNGLTNYQRLSLNY